ncbi:MAG: hypothetical protein R3D30_03415 [Hyphomicrobiales bacterium]
MWIKLNRRLKSFSLMMEARHLRLEDGLSGQRELFDKNGWHIDRRSHYGMSGARNHAARQAESTHLLFIEPGTVLKPNALATLNLAASCSGADVLDLLLRNI